MLSWLFKRFFGGYGEEKRHGGTLLVVECGEGSIRNKTTQEYIGKLTATGVPQMVFQCYPDFEAGRSGYMLRRYYNNEIDLSPMELLHINIANKIETFSKIRNLIDEGNTVVCERHWIHDVATAVSQGAKEADCVKAYPELIKGMPDSVLFVDVKHATPVGDGDDEVSKGDAKGAFKTYMKRFFREGASQAAFHQRNGKPSTVFPQAKKYLTVIEV